MWQKPGAYLEAPQARSDESPALNFGVLGLVGMANRGPVDQPQRVTSWGDFVTVFGDPVDHSYLAYAVYAFFENGGRVCWVVRVVDKGDRPAEIDLARLTDGQLPLRLCARSPGEWGNAIGVTCHSRSQSKIGLARLEKGEQLNTAIKKLNIPKGEEIHVADRATPRRFQTKVDPKFNIQIPQAHRFSSGAHLLGHGFSLVFRFKDLTETYDQLCLDPNHERFVCRVINGPAMVEDPLHRQRQGFSNLVTVGLTTSSQSQTSPPGTHTWRGRLKGGIEHRLPLRRAREYTGFRESNRPVRRFVAEGRRPTGLASTTGIAEIELVAIPDLCLIDLPHRENTAMRRGPIWRQNLAQAVPLPEYKTGLYHLVDHCDDGLPRFALLDPPRPIGADRGFDQVAGVARNFHLYSGSKNGAMYYPWVRLTHPTNHSQQLWMPPSGFLGGIFSKAARERGLAASPANYFLNRVQQLQVGLTRDEHARLNQKGINCLDCIPGQGIRVWGARTLWYGSRREEKTWTYIGVRLLYLRLMRFIQITLMEFAFEPNDPDLWDEIATTLSIFLGELYLAGDLAGQSEAEAFFVKCDEETNPPDSLESGRVIAELGIAPVFPAEFIWITVIRTENTVTVSQDSASSATAVITGV